MTTSVETKAQRPGKNLLVSTARSPLSPPSLEQLQVDRAVRQRPARITVCCLHTAMESLQKLQSLGDKNDMSDPLHGIPADVISILVHGGIDDKGYLINPGCGDVGVMDVGLRDD